MIQRQAVYRYWVVLLLCIIYMCAFIDRVILSLLIDPIRHSLDLSDTQISILIGLAFAVFYSVLGLPIGRWMDRRGSRRNLIAFGIFLWCLATASSGFATSFWTLLIARLMVGAGEATVVPGTYSLLADLFPKERLGFVMGIFFTGSTIGGGLAMMFGGWIVGMSPSDFLGPVFGDVESWRMSLVLVGLPGIFLALILLLSVREPPRAPATLTQSDAPTYAYLREHGRLYVPLFLSMATMMVISSSLMFWAPVYLMRVFSVGPPVASTVVGLALGVFGTVGMLGGGLICDVLLRRGRADAPIIIMVSAVVLAAGLVVFSFTAGSFNEARWGILLAAMLISLQGGPQAALLRMITPATSMGVVSALYLAANNILALGTIPVLTALASDRLFEGPRAIGDAVALTVLISSPISVLLFLSSRRRYLERAATLSQLEGDPKPAR